jgi:hypothetical protein
MGAGLDGALQRPNRFGFLIEYHAVFCDKTCFMGMSREIRILRTMPRDFMLWLWINDQDRAVVGPEVSGASK